MALTVQSIVELQQYAKGVFERAGHHAQGIEEISLAILGAIVWRADGQITVREYAGNPANMIWFQVDGKQYAMLYNHQTGKIELKDGSQKGPTLYTFDNTMSNKDVLDVFRNL